MTPAKWARFGSSGTPDIVRAIPATRLVLVAGFVLFWGAGCGRSSRAISGSGGVAGQVAVGSGGVAGQTAAGSGGAASGGSFGSGGAAGLSPGGGAGGNTPATGGSGAAGAASGGAGANAAGGTAGAPTSIACLTPAATLSPVIPTVATVTFSTTLADLQHAEIEFAPSAGGTTMVAPVDLTQPGFATFLVGMKQSTTYLYRVKVTGSTGTCVSDDQSLQTGSFANPPTPLFTISDPDHHDRGFTIVVAADTSSGAYAYIMDADGAVVWLSPPGSVPLAPTRAHLSWDARRLIAMAQNPFNDGSGAIVTMAMDGANISNLGDVATAHHDFTSIPGGIAAIFWNVAGGGDVPCSLIELSDGGERTTVVADTSTLYDVPNGTTQYHANSVHYYDADHSYTLGDRYASLYVKATGTGQLVWQFGGMNPKDPDKFFAGVTPWTISHGHHLTTDGTFALFNNTINSEPGPNSYSQVLVYQVDTAHLTATMLHQFQVDPTFVQGDVQKLPNGNFLVSSSEAASIVELTPAGGKVVKVQHTGLSYTEFRESLYGPPPY